MRNRPKVTENENVAFIKRANNKNKFVIIVDGKALGVRAPVEFETKFLAETCLWTHYYMGDLFYM